MTPIKRGHKPAIMAKAIAKRMCTDSSQVRLCKMYNENSLKIALLQRETDRLATWISLILDEGRWVDELPIKNSAPKITVATLTVVIANEKFINKQVYNKYDQVEDLEQKIMDQRKYVRNANSYYHYMDESLKAMTIDLWRIIAEYAPSIFVYDKLEYHLTRNLMDKAYDNFEKGFGEAYQLNKCYEIIRESQPTQMYALPV